MRIQFDGYAVSWRGKAWVEAQPGEDMSAQRVWLTDSALLSLSGKDLAEIAEAVDEVVGRDKLDEAAIVKRDDDAWIFRRHVMACRSQHELEVLPTDAPRVVVEDVVNEEGERVAVLMLGISMAGAKVRIERLGGRKNWRRSLLAARNEVAERLLVPGWMREELGCEDVASIPLVSVEGGAIAELLRAHEDECEVVPYLDWSRKEAAKSKAKMVSVGALGVIGIGLLAAGFVTDMQATTLNERADLLNQKAAMVEQEKARLEQDRFFVDWAQTPSLVSMLREATGSLGDAVRITSMTGKVEMGRGAKVEGIAVALRGKLKPAHNPHMKIETVMTEGKIGLRFELNRGPAL